MQRFLYFAGFVFIALCGSFVVRQLAVRPSALDPGFVASPVEVPAPPSPGSSGTSGAQWFAAMKPFCNSVEVDVRERYSPAPKTSEGAGYAAACFALAGKMGRAQTVIEGMPASERASAASVLFEVAHPVADAGDDRASGPMMELVLDYWPNNYMALYHAGMSEYSLGLTSLAEKHLREFLRLYPTQDGFNLNAQTALRAIGQANDAAASRMRHAIVELDSARKP
jgi:hypothetical protein